ncbi:hypothetical protein NIIDMKKI_01920 [Mycobacterium kansasii]|uniref:DUF6779 domain-containing protein n=1 Tax=Mycobacterium kansasii TaxID=1768 RepID=A0A7G1I1Q5_MYCKA|nr:hypothetical protein NIIDMKKI_01920 [Mycobacterium kansasii]
MTVLSRGARVRRGGRRPGWVLLTTLLVLAIAASSALVFTNRVELLKLAVILALWAAVAGAFVSVLYRRQADAEQARARDLKLVYDLQLDREISARREYELTVESHLRRELAAELRAAAADEVAALRAELTALRTSLEILFDTDFEHRPALEPMDKTGATEARRSRAVADRVQNGRGPSADWVSIDRVAVVRPGEAVNRAEEAIIDVPEVGMPHTTTGMFRQRDHCRRPPSPPERNTPPSGSGCPMKPRRLRPVRGMSLVTGHRRLRRHSRSRHRGNLSPPMDSGYRPGRPAATGRPGNPPPRQLPSRRAADGVTGIPDRKKIRGHQPGPRRGARRLRWSPITISPFD